MSPGLRTHKRASLRIAVPDLPEGYEGIREIVDLTSEDRGKGHARALMHTVCAEADRCGVVLMLTARPFYEEVIHDRGMSQDRLERFYARFGFVRIQESPVLMARQPEARRIVRAA